MDAILCTPVLDREMRRSIRGPAVHFSGASWSCFSNDSSATSGASHSEKVARIADNGTNEPLATKSAPRLRICASVSTTSASYSCLRIWFNAAHRAERYCEGDFEREDVIDFMTRYLCAILQRDSRQSRSPGWRRGTRAGSIEWSVGKSEEEWPASTRRISAIIRGYLRERDGNGRRNLLSMRSDMRGRTYKSKVPDPQMLSPSPLSLAARRLSLTARLFSSSAMVSRVFTLLLFSSASPPHHPP